MQLALKEVEGVFSVHMDLSTRKAVVQIEKGKATENQLVDAVSHANGMHQYRATVVKPTLDFQESVIGGK